MIDEKTIALVDEVIAQAGQRITKATAVPMTDDELDAIIGPPLTIDEHRTFYRMYIALLYQVMSNADLESESTVEALQTARSEMRSPVGLAALAELLQQQAWMDLLPALVGTVKGKEMLKGKRALENPIVQALREYLATNPGATAKQLWRDARLWLPDNAEIDGDELMFMDAKGREKSVGFEAFTRYVTTAKK